MAAVLIAILSLIVFGIPFVLALDRDAPPLRLLGLAFLYGAGAMHFVLLALSVAHIRWSLLSVTIAALIVMLALIPRARARARARARLHPVDIGTLAAPIAFTCFATIANLWEWDFWAIWGLKARVFLEAGGIDWRFLEGRWNTFVHPDYPLLVPLTYDFAALLGGGWSDRWLGLLFVAWAMAFLLVARELAGREATPLVAALIAFALSFVAVPRYIGLAEGALVAYVGAGVLFVRRALIFDDDVAWRHGAILLGLAACTKNEGLAMLVSVAIAIALTAPRQLKRLWPAAAVAAPWLILRALHDFPTDVVSGSALSRLAARARDAGTILRALEVNLYDEWLWLALLVGVLVLPAVARRRERFVLVAVIVQLLVYVGAYFVTPHDPVWHIGTSWPRLPMQIIGPLVYAVMIELANAEARSQQP